MTSKKEIKLLSELLDLEGIKVVSHRQHQGIGIMLRIESTNQESICPRCGTKSQRLHQNHRYVVKDLPWGEQQVFLEINRRQFKCSSCKKPFSEDLEFVRKRRTYPKGLAQKNIKEVYVLLKNESDLNQSQKQKLAQVKEVFPALKSQHDLKEKIRKIFDKTNNWLDGLLKLGKWLNEAKNHFPDSRNTMLRWFDEIVAYFDNRTTSGVVEGINNKLKLIKRSAMVFHGNIVSALLGCLLQTTVLILLIGFYCYY